MALDLNKLKASTKPFASIQTSIGDLYLFEVRVKEIIALEKKLGNKLEEIESEEFFRHYLPFFAYLKQDLVGEELERPEEYTFKGEDANRLSKDEIEEIAKLFIEGNSSLHKDWKSSRTKKEDGTHSITLKEEVDESLLKHDDESYVEYVYRLVLEKHNKDQERAKEMLSSFSSRLSEDILKTMGVGESLKSSFESLKSVGDITKSLSPSFVSVESVKQNFSEFDFAEMHREQETSRLAPFKDLSSKMDMMIKAEKETVSFMDDVYKTQVQIANELKSSSDSANDHSLLNIKYTKLIIWLTVISTLITTVSLVYTVWFDNDSEQMIMTNESIKSTIVETNLKLEKLTEVLIKQNKMQTKHQKVLQQEIQNLKNNFQKQAEQKEINND